MIGVSWFLVALAIGPGQGLKSLRQEELQPSKERSLQYDSFVDRIVPLHTINHAVTLRDNPEDTRIHPFSDYARL